MIQNGPKVINAPIKEVLLGAFRQEMMLRLISS